MLDKRKVKEMEETTGHSVFGPSSMPRIMLCPASVNESLKVPPQESSIFAKQGTKLHLVVSDIQENKTTFEKMVDELTVVEASYVWDCLQWSEKIQDIHKDSKFVTHNVETPISLANWDLPEITGTADDIVISETRIDVTDWKFGQGVPRHAEGDYQGVCYAAGALGKPEELDPDFPVYIHIVQPPLNIFDTWELTYRELQEIIQQEVYPTVQNAKGHNPEYNPGLSQCRFCAANMVCRARYASTKQTAAAVFNTFAELTIVPDEKIAELLCKATAIQQYIKDAQLYAGNRIRKGYGFPNFKMVAGRGSRVWKDSKAAKAWLQKQGYGEDQLYVKKFVSPPQAEKLNRTLKKDDNFKDLWEKKEGKPILVEETDKRPAIEFSATEIFNKYAVR